MKRVTCRCGKADAANQFNLKSGPAELNPDVALYPGYFDDAPSGSNLLQNGGKVAIPSPRTATESPYSSPLDGVPRLLTTGRDSFFLFGPRGTGKTLTFGANIFDTSNSGATLHRSMSAGFLLCEFAAKPLGKRVLKLHRPRESHQALFI